ncbi:amino acid ABC transporter substrate-binding protein [Clostridia bacterium]|nr:amino acid ABC transporter substrate-binding protein [Clostridia bacterium]
MKSIGKKIAALTLALVLTGSLLVGCSDTNTEDKTDTDTSKSADAGTDVTTIRVGTGNAYKPYCYIDDDGNLAGYEFEVLKAVDELLPQYEFTYEQYDFKNILLSIDAGKVDIGAHQFEINEDRVANYLFGEVPYTTFIRYIVVAKDKEGISTLDDLAGKKVYASPGDNATYLFEQYNKEHADNPIKLDIIEGLSNEEIVTGIKSGKWDAYSATKRDIEDRNKQYGDVLKIVGEPIISSNTYFVFKKGNTELQSAVDGALTQLKENGKLSQISIDVIGGDYTESE